MAVVVEETGLWWFPETPESRVQGYLKITASGESRLSIPIGTLRPVDQMGMVTNGPSRFPLICGILGDGRHVALRESILVSSLIRFPGALSEAYQSECACVATNPFDLSESISAVRIRVPHLREWVGNLSKWSELTLSKDDELELQYGYRTPAEEILCEHRGAKILVEQEARWGLPTVAGFHLKHDCLLRCNWDVGCTVSEAEDLVGRLIGFVTFCLNKPVTESGFDLQFKGQATWVNMFRRAVSETPESRSLIPQDMLLSFEQVTVRGKNLTRSWLAARDDLGRALGLLMALMWNKEPANEMRFLAATQALEAVARVHIDDREMDRAECRRRRRVISAALPDVELRDWVVKKLQDAHRKSADAMLDELLDYIGCYVDLLFPDRRRFRRILRDNRNFYTHRDGRGSRDVWTGENLYVLCEGTICLLKAVVLRTAGWSDEEVVRLMMECRDTEYWTRRVADHFPQSSSTN